MAPAAGVSGLARVPCALGTFTGNLADEETAGTRGGAGGTRFEDTNFLFPKSRPCDWTCGLRGGDAAGCMILHSRQDATERPFLFIRPHVVQHLWPLFCPAVTPSTELSLGHHQSPSLRVIQGLQEPPEEGGNPQNHSSELPLEQTVAKKRRGLARAGKKQTP